MPNGATAMNEWQHLPERTLSRSVQLGFAAEIFWRSGALPSQSWIIPVHILPAIQLGQVEFAFDATGAPEALVTWAFLEDSVAAQLEADPWRLMHFSEWNEGTNLWVMAMLSVPGRAAPLLLRVLRGRLAGYERVRGYQRHRDGLIGRLIDRSRPHRRHARRG